ncbi:RING/U-box superfamily protein [Trifolium repens]|nr:RING/U-box superfamily protein [Trifolium repens]
MGQRKLQLTSYECPSCHRLFCAQCKVPWHADMNCRKFQKLKNVSDKEQQLDMKFLELAKRKEWQKCPRCSMHVEKATGCRHMTCRCGCYFCYSCGGDWSSGHMCKHFAMEGCAIGGICLILGVMCCYMLYFAQRAET